jgi:hypothetical protein
MAARPAEKVSDKPLTLAQAFDLLRQALVELPSPSGAEAVRNRMAALFGRSDPLLETARFARFLRQAHDAEMADVRSVGDNEFEVSPRPGLRQDRQVTSQARSETEVGTAAPSSNSESPGEVGAPANGKRPGLRFRRGSRGGVARQDIPMVGVVMVEDAAPVPVRSEQSDAVGRKPSPNRGRGRVKATGAGKKTEADVVAPAAPAVKVEAPAAHPKKPRRPRAKKP